MKRLFALLIGTLIVLPLFAAENQDLKNAEALVVKCKNEIELRQAMDAGAIFVQTNRGSYFVKTPDKYAGPFRDLATAVKVRRQYNLDIPASGQKPGASSGSSGFVYNPQLMMFPFIETPPKAPMGLNLPSGEIVPASQVMIHPNPFGFDDVAFAPIDIYSSLRSLATIRKNKAPDPNQLPQDRRDDKYYAVTGRISLKETVKDPTPALEYWVGASIVDAEGKVLWLTYGPVESNYEFKCTKQFNPGNGKPQSLLLFILGKGKLKQMLTPDADISSMDATAYTYHVLGSIALEVGPDWFPPVQKAAEQEYRDMFNKMRDRKPPIQPPGFPQ